ncbi:hypothetical protein, partial [Craurococcus roseus]|uniref:hypothetical protein n=1 Tax=Craurococcus roseus TaxID=77585 RepID=UPI0031D23516
DAAGSIARVVAEFGYFLRGRRTGLHGTFPPCRGFFAPVRGRRVRPVPYLRSAHFNVVSYVRPIFSASLTAASTDRLSRGRAHFSAAS